MSVRKKDRPYTSQLKGVAALLGNDSVNVAIKAAAEFIKIDDIQLPGSQPRKYFDPVKLGALAHSIRQHGVLEPLLVRQIGQMYELVAGERRYRASKMAALTEVPVVVKNLNDEEAIQITLIENLQREDLNPVEETEGILQLLAFKLEVQSEDVISLLYRMQNETKGKVTQNVLGSSEAEMVQGVFEALGTMGWESFINTRLALLKLPNEVLLSLRKGEIAYTKAKAISRIKDDRQRQALLEESVEQALSLSQIRRRLTDLQAGKPEVKTKEVKGADPYVLLRKRIDNVYRAVRKSKVYDDPTKQRHLEDLLTSIEALVSV